jgi:hypothetical protein
MAAIAYPELKKTTSSGSRRQLSSGSSLGGLVALRRTQVLPAVIVGFWGRFAGSGRQPLWLRLLGRYCSTLGEEVLAG